MEQTIWFNIGRSTVRAVWNQTVSRDGCSWLVGESGGVHMGGVSGGNFTFEWASLSKINFS